MDSSSVRCVCDTNRAIHLHIPMPFWSFPFPLSTVATTAVDRLSTLESSWTTIYNKRALPSTFPGSHRMWGLVQGGFSRIVQWLEVWSIESLLFLWTLQRHNVKRSVRALFFPNWIIGKSLKKHSKPSLQWCHCRFQYCAVTPNFGDFLMFVKNILVWRHLLLEFKIIVSFLWCSLDEKKKISCAFRRKTANLYSKIFRDDL